MRISAVNICWTILYLVSMFSVMGGMLAARDWSTVTYGTEAAHGQWHDWRSVVKSQTEGKPAQSAPVRRRVPRSDEPPALVLMRDHFWVCVIFAMVLSSALFVTAMVALRGAFRTGSKS